LQTLRRGRASFAVGSAVALTLGLTFAACGRTDPNEPMEDTGSTEQAVKRTCSTAGVGIHDGMRKLWEDHITWTRMVIISVASRSDDLGPTLDRLLQNQTDIGNAIKPYYGDAAGDALTALLRDHILIAGEILFAARDGNQEALADAIARWYANADDIAAFLSSANPDNWPLEEMQAMMREHLDVTLREAVARLEGRYADDIAAYDVVHVQALGMADMLSAGIVAQFPNSFK
jgi:hypothetical protein